MRQLGRDQKQKPCQRIKYKRVVKSKPIEDTQKQCSIPSLVLDTIYLPTEAADTHQRASIQMLKPVLKIVGVLRRMPKRELMSVEIGVRNRIGEPMV